MKPCGLWSCLRATSISVRSPFTDVFDGYMRFFSHADITHRGRTIQRISLCPWEQSQGGHGGRPAYLDRPGGRQAPYLERLCPPLGNQTRDIKMSVLLTASPPALPSFRTLKAHGVRRGRTRHTRSVVHVVKAVTSSVILDNSRSFSRRECR